MCYHNQKIRTSCCAYQRAGGRRRVRAQHNTTQHNATSERRVNTRLEKNQAGKNCSPLEQKTNCSTALDRAPSESLGALHSFALPFRTRMHGRRQTAGHRDHHRLAMMLYM